jgi:hypothetical protein
VLEVFRVSWVFHSLSVLCFINSGGCGGASDVFCFIPNGS